jgi:hypothetical protein
MKIIITESKRERAVTKWLESEYGGLKYKVSKDYPDLYYFIKDGNVVMDYYEKYSRLCASNEIIDFVMRMFGFDWKNARDLVESWFQDSYGYDVNIITGPLSHHIRIWKSYSDNPQDY